MIRFGMIGAGGVARAHSKAILENDACTLNSVCDINIKKAEEVATEHGAHVCADYKEIQDVDAVIINLPHYLHCEVSCYFLQKGIHVLVEKPMANTVDECDKMINSAKGSAAKLAVGHVQRYYSALRQVKEFIISKRFGKLCMITEVRNINYTNNRPDWFLKKELSGGGIVMNYGAHSFDRLFYTTGLKVKNVYSVTSNPLTEHNVEINAQILAELEDGVTAAITYCGCNTPSEYETIFYFTDGVVKILNSKELCIYENGEYVNYGGENPLIKSQLCEFLKYLKNEKTEVAMPEYGREIIKVLKNII